MSCCVTDCYLRYVVASLFRVTWGFVLAAIMAIPLGLAIGWYRRAEMAFNPLLQFFRPISPLAWIPIAILWFGVGDASCNISNLPGMLVSVTSDRHQRGSEYSCRLYQRRAQFRSAVAPILSIAFCIRQ